MNYVTEADLRLSVVYRLKIFFTLVLIAVKRRQLCET